MNFIRNFLNFFTTITSSVLIIVALSSSMGDYGPLDASILWDIVLAGTVTSVVTAVVYSIDYKTVKQYIFASVIHYILLCIIMIFMGAAFGWSNLTVGGILGMVLDVTVVYAMVFGISYLLNKKEADSINDALGRKYNEK